MKMVAFVDGTIKKYYYLAVQVRGRPESTWGSNAQMYTNALPPGGAFAG
jgi:hypothetical protein